MIGTHFHLLESNKELIDVVSSLPCMYSIHNTGSFYQHSLYHTYNANRVLHYTRHVDIPIGPINFVNRFNDEDYYIHNLNKSMAEPSNYLLHIPYSELLNNDFTIGLLGDQTRYGKKFIRPYTGFKTFPGQVVDFSDKLDVSKFKQTYHVHDDTLIMISSPKVILQEWRFFIINNKIIDYSPYEWLNETKFAVIHPNHIDEVNRKLLEFAEKQAQNSIFKGDTYLTLDIAYTGFGDFKIVELNAGVTSGFYSASKEKILRTIIDNFATKKEYFI